MANLARSGFWITLVMAASVVLGGGGASARRTPENAVPADLRQAANDYDKAQQQGDEGGLRRLLAADYLLVNSGGSLETRAQFIAESIDPQFKLEPFEVQDEVVRMTGAQAVLGGVATLSGIDHGHRFSERLRFADVWQKRSGVWQVIYTQVTKAADPAS